MTLEWQLMTPSTKTSTSNWLFLPKTCHLFNWNWSLFSPNYLYRTLNWRFFDPYPLLLRANLSQLGAQPGHLGPQLRHLEYNLVSLEPILVILDPYIMIFNPNQTKCANNGIIKAAVENILLTCGIKTVRNSRFAGFIYWN